MLNEFSVRWWKVQAQRPRLTQVGASCSSQRAERGFAAKKPYARKEGVTRRRTVLPPVNLRMPPAHAVTATSAAPRRPARKALAPEKSATIALGRKRRRTIEAQRVGVRLRACAFTARIETYHSMDRRFFVGGCGYSKRYLDRSITRSAFFRRAKLPLPYLVPSNSLLVLRS
jgi:hypothetical protein